MGWKEEEVEEEEGEGWNEKKKRCKKRRVKAWRVGWEEGEVEEKLGEEWDEKEKWRKRWVKGGMRRRWEKEVEKKLGEGWDEKEKWKKRWVKAWRVGWEEAEVGEGWDDKKSSIGILGREGEETQGVKGVLIIRSILDLLVDGGIVKEKLVERPSQSWKIRSRNRLEDTEENCNRIWK